MTDTDEAEAASSIESVVIHVGPTLVPHLLNETRVTKPAPPHASDQVPPGTTTWLLNIKRDVGLKLWEAAFLALNDEDLAGARVPDNERHYECYPMVRGSNPHVDLQIVVRVLRDHPGMAKQNSIHKLLQECIDDQLSDVEVPFYFRARIEWVGSHFLDLIARHIPPAAPPAN